MIAPPSCLLLIRAVSGTLLIIGLVFVFIERHKSESVLLLESSTRLPPWIGWAGYVFTLVARIDV
jgi:hypothetical protein